MKTIKSSALIIIMIFVSKIGFTQQETIYERDYGFEVNADARIVIESSFTNVTLTSWNEDRVMVSVYAKTQGATSSKSDRLMEKVTVEVNGSSSLIDIVSKFSKNGNVNGKSEIDIRLNIKAPSSVHLDFECSFGDIDIPDWDGYCKLDVQFGDLNLENLNHEKAEIDVQYSDVSMENANDLEVKSAFSDVSIEQVDHLDLDSQYDDIEVEKVNTIDADSQFSDLEIGTVSKEIILDTQYGGVDIENILAGFERIEIENQFGEVKLYIDPNANYALDVDMSFASFNFDEKSSLNHEKEGFNDEHFWGNVGTGGGIVDIESSFGGVRIR